MFLLYLNDEAFLDEDGDVARLVQAAMDRRIAIVPVHEQDPGRGGCPFRLFLQQTPQVLQRSPYSSTTRWRCRSISRRSTAR